MHLMARLGRGRLGPVASIPHGVAGGAGRSRDTAAARQGVTSAPIRTSAGRSASQVPIEESSMTGARFSALLGVCSAFSLGVAAAQSTVRVNVSSINQATDGSTREPSISRDGRTVIFYSNADNLVPNDANGAFDVFLRDRLQGQTVLASVSSHGRPGNGASHLCDAPCVSDDGLRVVFASYATDLVPGDTNGFLDVFVRDVGAETTVRVSVDSAGHQTNANSLGGFSISGNGRFVVFSSEADNLVAGDTNGADDIFVHDIRTGQTILASVGPAGAPGNGNSYAPSGAYDAP